MGDAPWTTRNGSRHRVPSSCGATMNANTIPFVPRGRPSREPAAKPITRLSPARKNAGAHSYTRPGVQAFRRSGDRVCCADNLNARQPERLNA